MEPVFAGLFGYLLAGDRLRAVAWVGAAVILAGMLVAEPALRIGSDAREEGQFPYICYKET